MKSVIIFSILCAVSFANAQDAVYVDQFGLQAIGKDGKISYRRDEKLWKYSKEGNTETFISTGDTWMSDRTMDKKVHIVKDGSSVIAFSKSVTTLTKPPQFNGYRGIDYEITDAKTYLKQCSDSSSGKNSKCELVSAEMCGKLYGETMKLTDSEIGKCTDLMAKVNAYHDEALKNFDQASSMLLSGKFPETKSLQTAKSGDYAGTRSLYVFGSLCRRLRCQQGVVGCLGENYFPTLDRPVPSAKPIVETGTR